MNNAFWHNKKVFLTGHTGFKGCWLTLLLQELGAKVTGYALAPQTSPSLFEATDLASHMDSHIGDIRDKTKLQSALDNSNADIVLHLAAQALVKESYSDPVETFGTNVIGTQIMLECLRKSVSVKAALFISTDKVYENHDWCWGYRENDQLGGHDPYSASKACMEILLSSYRRSFFNETNSTAIASARAGNVIGGGDWAKDRLIPDILNAIGNNHDLTLRYPDATRPWQHVLEPLSGYLLLAENLYQSDANGKYCRSWNFGPEYSSVRPVKEIASYLIEKSGSQSRLKVSEQEHAKESNFLALDSSDACFKLGWQPRMQLKEAIDSIWHWYNGFQQGQDAKVLCQQQIRQFMAIPYRKGL